MNAIFYPAIFHPEETGYSIGLMLEDCKVCPEPSVPSALHVDPEDFVVMVPFDMEEYEKRYRPVKKTLSIPGWLNDAAESAHINFSGVLQATAAQQLTVMVMLDGWLFIQSSSSAFLKLF